MSKPENMRSVEFQAGLWLAVLAVAVLWGGFFYETLHWTGNLFDDAYIYLRYAENLLGGCALEWNCGGGRVEGYTSPLYLGLLTSLGVAGMDLADAATALGIASWGIALTGFVLLPVVFREELGIRTRWLAGGIALAIAAALSWDQLIAINAASGMEGGIVCLALLGMAILSFRPGRLAVAAPFAVVVRPELGLATLLQPLLGREHLRKAAITAIAVFGGVTLVRFLVFHDVFPNTFWAKSGGSVDHLEAGLGYLATSYSRFALAGLVVLGFFSRVAQLRYLASFVVAWSAYFLWSGGDFYSFARLFAFLAPLAYFVGLVAGAEILRDRVGTRASATILAVVTAASILLSWGFRDRYAPGAGFTNVELWKQTGKYLNECFPGESIAAVPIGAIAYFSKAPVYDMVGLTDPRVAIGGQRGTGDDFVVGHERFDPEWTLALRPGVIFFDTVPESQSVDVTIKYAAERELLEEVRQQQAPYLQFSPRLESGNSPFLFVREDVAMETANKRPQCVETQTREP